MKSGALFAGYGGVERAVAEVLGAEPAWFCEFDPAPSKILAAHWPGVPNYGDVTKVDWSQVEHVEVVTGGFPCQDVSGAGKRAGLKEGTRSGLWAHMCDAVAALRPRLVLAENVRGLLNAEGEEPTDAILRLEDRRDHLARSLRLVERKLARALREGNNTHAAYHRRDAVRLARLLKRAVGAVRRERAGLVRAIATVLRDLADIGYDAAWVGLRAADVGAPHGRFRVFILAWPTGDAGTLTAWPTGDAGTLTAWPTGDAGTLLKTPTSQLAVNGGSQHPDKRRSGGHGPTLADEVEHTLPTPTVSDANGVGAHGDGGLDLRTAIHLLPTPAVNDMGAGKTVDAWDAWTDRMRAEHGNGNGHGASLSIEALRMLPTPRATDGTKGGPNQRGSSGDLMLPSAVQLMPTPTVTNANVVDLMPTPTAMDSNASGGAVGSSNVTLTDATIRGRGLMPTPSAADAMGGHERRGGARGEELLLNGLAKAGGLERFGQYAPAIARWEAVLGRTAPAPTEPTGKGGGHRLSPAFVEWMMGLPAGWVTDLVADRAEATRRASAPDIAITRNEALKALGNGVVPQQCATALRYLLGVRAAALEGRWAA